MRHSPNSAPPSSERVRQFVLDHFEWLATGRIEQAPRQLIVPPGETMRRPLELYLDCSSELA